MKSPTWFCGANCTEDGHFIGVCELKMTEGRNQFLTRWSVVGPPLKKVFYTNVHLKHYCNVKTELKYVKIKS